MRWFRSNAKAGGCLALFALVLQFVVGFAHIHPNDLAGGPISLPVSALSAPENAATPQGRSPDAACDVCLAISLLGASHASEPPRLPLLIFGDPQIAATDDLTSFARHRGHFQSRAPPIA